MPEYNNIQVHKKVSDFSDPRNYEEFCQLTKSMGIYDQRQFNLNNSNWADLGTIDFLYFQDTVTSQHQFENVTLSIRPIIMGISHRAEEAEFGKWLQFDVLFHTDEIVDFTLGKYRIESTHAVFETFFEFSRHFPNDPVFLTNEGSDSQPWQGMLDSDFDLLKMFDLASFPAGYDVKDFRDDHNYSIVNSLGKHIVVNELAWNADAMSQSVKNLTLIST